MINFVDPDRKITKKTGSGINVHEQSAGTTAPGLAAVPTGGGWQGYPVEGYLFITFQTARAHSLVVSFFLY